MRKRWGGSRETVAAPAQQPVAPADDTAGSVRVSGKGRPTPKRSEAQTRRRRPVEAPTSRRQVAKATRLRLQEERRQSRRALASGDERYLPARDAGPVRKFVRNFVDARRNAGGLFFFGAVIVLGLSLTRLPALIAFSYALFLTLWIGIIVDSILLVRRVRRVVKERFPGESDRGLGFYAVMRALQIRRLRLPPPTVARGARV